MNVEQRLVAALRQADLVEPSPDLWSRVVHSIEEDRQHRRRVRTTAAAIAVIAALLLGIGAVSIVDGPFGQHVHRWIMEALEVVALSSLVVVLGPAIRRFGRGYANDLWPADSSMPTGLLGLLDVAYYLVLAGYILLSTEFEFDNPATADLLAGQVEEATQRLGGLMLLLGVLHAATLMALPVVALVDNSTRASRSLPRWVVFILIAVTFGASLIVIPNLIGLIVSGTS